MKITAARVIVTCPGRNFVTLKIETDEGITGIGDATLNRFFAFHVIAVPLVLLGLVVFHLLALHDVGSNNPDGIEIKKKKDANGKPLDGIPFHPYFTVKDIGPFVLASRIQLFVTTMYLPPDTLVFSMPEDGVVPTRDGAARSLPILGGQTERMQ